MKQNQWQILLVILLFMSVYVLFNSNMYNSILGRTILVITVIILTKYNIMLGLGLVILIIYMCPNAYSGYIEGMETTTPTTSDTSAMTKQATDMITQLMNSPGLSSLTSETDKKKIASPITPVTAVTTPVTTPTTTVVTPTTTVATPAVTTTESFKNNKKHYNSNQLSVEEKLRPKSSVTSKIYNRTSTNKSTELLSGNSSLGFSFLH